MTVLNLGIFLNKLNKFNRNFADTDDTLCLFKDGIEDNGNFFFDCHQFTEIRNTLTNNICRLGLDIHTFARNKKSNYSYSEEVPTKMT